MGSYQRYHLWFSCGHHRKSYGEYTSVENIKMSNKYCFVCDVCNRSVTLRTAIPQEDYDKGCVPPGTEIEALYKEKNLAPKITVKNQKEIVAESPNGLKKIYLTSTNEKDRIQLYVNSWGYAAYLSVEELDLLEAAIKEWKK